MDALAEILPIDSADPAAPDAGEPRALDRIQQDELAELRGVSMGLARALGARATAVLEAGEGTVEDNGAACSVEGALLARAYTQLVAGIRQLMVLERECAGLRPPPGLRGRAEPAAPPPAPPCPIDKRDFAAADRALVAADPALPEGVRDGAADLALFERLPYQGALAHLNRAVDLARKAEPRDRFQVLNSLSLELDEVTSELSYWDWKESQPDPDAFDLDEAEPLTEDERGLIRRFADHVDSVLRGPAPKTPGTGPPRPA